MTNPPTEEDYEEVKDKDKRFEEDRKHKKGSKRKNGKKKKKYTNFLYGFFLWLMESVRLFN